MMTISTTTTQLHMGLFDGVKEAFAAPARTTVIDAERETPIDRWMGWSVTKDKDTDANAIMAPQARTYAHQYNGIQSRYYTLPAAISFLLLIHIYSSGGLRRLNGREELFLC